jgi:PAS domain S-box-containing protein
VYSGFEGRCGGEPTSDEKERAVPDGKGRGPWLNVLLLVVIMGLVTLGVRQLSLQLLLGTIVANERAHLAQAASVQARLLGSLLSPGEDEPPEFGAFDPRLVVGADVARQFGETGEVVYARLEGEWIRFFPTLGIDLGIDDEAGISVSIDSALAEPMHRAVQGLTGTMIGLDYRGERVIAAYHPVEGGPVGVVVKVDLAEVRGYLRQANAISVPASIGLLAFGLVAFALAGRPLQRRAMRSERRFAHLVDTLTEGVGITDADGNLVYANDRYCEMLGRSHRELVGKPIRAYLGPNGRIAREHPADDAGGRFETSIPKPDGGAVEILAALRPIDARRGERSGVVAVLTDITELKRAQNEALKAGNRAREYLDIAGVILLALDREGRVTMINRRGLEILGHDEGELDGADWVSTCIPPRDRGRLRAVMEQLMSGAAESVENYENPILTKDGEERTIAWQNEVLRDADGAIVGTLSSGTDVTERRRIEDALRVSEARYRSLYENAALGIYQTTPDGKILATNRTALRMLGFDSFDELADRNLEKDGYEPGYSRDEFKERVEREGEITGFESAWIRKDGSSVYVRESARAIRDDDGNVLFYEGTIEDITAEREAEEERRAMEAQLRQSQKLESIGTLASGVAHEINNPLTGIINYAHLIRDRTSDASLRRFAEGIAREGERVAEIVRNLLAFSRHEKESHSPARIHDIVNGTLSLVTAVLRKDQIRVEVDVPSDLPNVRCRSQQIQQVLMNLLTNARDALNARYPEFDEDKVVRIVARSVSEDGKGWIRLTVEDHGAGIPDAVVGRIFDPFFTTKPRDRGTGLGLSISHGIVRDHGGSLSVESEPGAYTRFIVKLPIDNGWRLAEEEVSDRPSEEE